MRIPRVLVVVLLVSVASLAMPASAVWGQTTSGSSTPPSTSDTAETVVPSTLPGGAVSIGEGYSFSSAIVTPGDGSPQRTMNALQAAVFVQSFIGEIFFGQGTTSPTPPPGVPVSRVDVYGTWGDGTGYQTVYYADDGTTVWISYPNHDVTPEPASPPPQPEIWIATLPRVRDAYNGTAGLVASGGTTAKPPTTTVPSAAKSSDSGSSPTPWIVLAVVIVVIALVIGFFIARRRRAPDDDVVDDDIDVDAGAR